MEGIAEQHLVSFCAGLASEGFIPFFNTISTFIYRRALEQLIIDCALENLPVKILGSGAGMVYAPLGPTHQAIDDLAHLLSVPNLLIASPVDPLEMKETIKQVIEYPGPAFVRIGKGGEPVISSSWEKLIIGEPRYVEMKIERSLLVISTGAISGQVNSALDKLNSAKVSWVHLNYLKPLNFEKFDETINTFEKIVVFEEHVATGGLMSLIKSRVRKNRILFYHFCLPDKFAEKYGTQLDHWRLNSIDCDSIEKNIKFILEN
jgi:transketolase